MNQNVLTSKSNLSAGKRKTVQRNDLVKFVANQFKQLAKKNLKAPFQLYNL